MAKGRRIKGEGHIHCRNGVYYLRITVNGKSKEQSLRTRNRKEAEAKATEYRPIVESQTKEAVAMHVAEARGLQKAGKVKLAEAWAKFLKTKPNISAGTLGNHERNWLRFLEWMRSNRPGIESLGQLDVESAKDYMSFFANTGVHSDTFNKQKLTLAKVWDELADEAGLRKADNPFRDIEVRRNESFSRENLSEDELLSILRTLDNPPFHLLNASEVRTMFTLGAFAGMRLADCALLRWNSVLSERGIIAFTPRKTARGTGRLVKIPIHPEVELQLKLAAGWRVDDYVLPKTAARYQQNPTGVKSDVIKAFEACGFKTSEKVPGRLQPRSIYGFHSLRHTFVSICANRGVPLAIVQELVGHGNPAITRHYFHSDEGSVRKAIATLPSATPALSESPRDTIIKAIPEHLQKADDKTLEKIAKLLGMKMQNSEIS